MLRVNKDGIKLWLGGIVFFTLLITGINAGNNKEYQQEIVTIFLALGTISFFSYWMTSKSNLFLWTTLSVSFTPFIFGFLIAGISIWMIAFVPHWSWISIILGAYWGMWFIPILLPKLSKQIEAELIHPKTKFGKAVMILIVSVGGFGGAASGRLASRAARGGSDLGIVFGGFGIMSLAFFLQYLAVFSQWDYFQKSKKQEELKCSAS